MTEPRGGVVLPGSGNRLPPANDTVAVADRRRGRKQRLIVPIGAILVSDHCSFLSL